MLKVLEYGAKSLNVISNVATITVQGVAVAESGVKIYQIYKKSSTEGGLNKQDKLELVAEVFCAVLQTTSMVAGGYRFARPNSANTHVFKGMELAVNAGAGVSFITKAALPMVMGEGKITNEQISNLIGVILFRVSDVANVATCEPFYCKPVHKSFEVLGNVTTIAGAGLMLITKKESLCKTATVFFKWAKKGGSLVAGGVNKIGNKMLVKGSSKDKEAQKSSQVVSGSGRASVDVGDEKEIMITTVKVGDDKDEKKIKGKVTAHFDEVYKIVINPNDMKQIPEELKFDSILSQFICGITGNPIRFIAVVEAGDMDDIVYYYYERDAISEALSNQNKPDNWPKGVEFKSDNVSISRMLQYQINKRLHEIADEWKKIFKEEVDGAIENN